jgi:chaperone modulatory protein CbpM
MMPIHEFTLRVRVERELVETWIAEGWLLPEGGTEFSEIDVARAYLIKDLKSDFGVNDEGISIILHLLDQMHGLRRSMRELAAQLAQEPTRPTPQP